MNKLAVLLAILVLPIVHAYPEVVDSAAQVVATPQGNILDITYTIQDANPLGRVVTDVFWPGIINHQDTTQAPSYIYTYEEQFFVPPTIPKHPVQIKITPVAGQSTYISIPITNQQDFANAHADHMSDTQDKQRPTTKDDLSIVVKPTIDVMQGAAIYYPVTIKNHKDEPITVTLGLQGAKQWASYSVLPQPTLTLQPEENARAYIYFVTDETAPTGMQHFKIAATYDGFEEQKDIALAVLRPAQENQQKTHTSTDWKRPLVILLVILFIILIIALALRQKKKEEEEDELITYY